MPFRARHRPTNGVSTPWSLPSTSYKPERKRRTARRPPDPVTRTRSVVRASVRQIEEIERSCSPSSRSFDQSRSDDKDNRYRIQRNTHRNLVSKRGSYIFVDDRGRSKRVPARQVSRMVGRGKWYKDRKPAYSHKFVRKRQVFRGRRRRR